MKSIYLVMIMTSLSLFSLAQYKNVQIDKQSGLGYPPCEPSIAISYTNPDVLVAGAILDKVYTSKDGGATWTNSKLKSELGVFGDPCVVSDYKGNFYYLHLSDPSGKGWRDDSLLDRIVCQYSEDNGKTWTKGSSIGLNGSKDQDKEWATIDPKSNRIFATWTQFDKYNSVAENDSTLILFSWSKGRDKEWSKPVRISQIAGDCLDDDNTVEGAVPAVGPEGNIYVSWALNETLYFDRSENCGKNWLEEDIIAGQINGGWNQEIPGINRCNGMPVTKVDLSEGPNKGTIYINYSDQTHGKDDTDIWLIKSTDFGDTWSEPIKVNDDNSGKHQFFTWMDVDKSNGNIYIVFYDRRNYDDNQTDVYLATSIDGGLTFTNELISESPFTPNQSVFFGDYNNITAFKGIVRPIWTRYENNKLSIWTALIDK